MQKFLNLYRIVVLIASGGAELTAGYLMSFYPETFFEQPDEQLISLAGSFAVGATTMGIYSFMLLFLKERQAQLAGFAVLALYHAGIGITQAICGGGGYTALAFHGWLCVSLVGLMVWKWGVVEA